MWSTSPRYHCRPPASTQNTITCSPIFRLCIWGLFSSSNTFFCMFPNVSLKSVIETFATALLESRYVNLICHLFQFLPSWLFWLRFWSSKRCNIWIWEKCYERYCLKCCENLWHEWGQVENFRWQCSGAKSRRETKCRSCELWTFHSKFEGKTILKVSLEKLF